MRNCVILLIAIMVSTFAKVPAANVRRDITVAMIDHKGAPAFGMARIPLAQTAIINELSSLKH